MTMWRGLARDQILTAIIQRASDNAITSRSSTGYHYQMGPPPSKKMDVLVVGDKLWNPTLLLLHGSPNLLGSLEDRLSIPVRLVYAIRNPFDVIATMHRRSTLPVRDRIRWYFMHCEAAEALRERFPAESFLESHYSDLVTSPDVELRRIADFLGLPNDPEHVERVRAMLFERPSQTSASIDWDPIDVADILDRMGRFPCLDRYRGELDRFN